MEMFFSKLVCYAEMKKRWTDRPFRSGRKSRRIGTSFRDSRQLSAIPGELTKNCIGFRWTHGEFRRFPVNSWRLSAVSRWTSRDFQRFHGLFNGKDSGKFFLKLFFTTNYRPKRAKVKEKRLKKVGKIRKFAKNFPPPPLKSLRLRYNWRHWYSYLFVTPLVGVHLDLQLIRRITVGTKVSGKGRRKIGRKKRKMRSRIRHRK